MSRAQDHEVGVPLANEAVQLSSRADSREDDRLDVGETPERIPRLSLQAVLLLAKLGRVTGPVELIVLTVRRTPQSAIRAGHPIR